MRYPRAAARVIRPRGPKAASVPPLARPRGRGDSAFGRRRCIRRKSCKLQDLLQNAVMDEIAPGILHWQARHLKIGIDVSSYWLPGLKLLLDPVATPDKVEQVEHILLSCRHHVRDSLEAAERFGATIEAPRTGMHEYGEDTPIQPYDFGEALIGGAVTAHQVGRSEEHTSELQSHSDLV